MSQSVENFLECPDIWNVFCAYNKCHHFANVTLQSGDADGSTGAIKPLTHGQRAGRATSSLSFARRHCTNLMDFLCYPKKHQYE